MNVNDKIVFFWRVIKQELKGRFSYLRKSHLAMGIDVQRDGRLKQNDETCLC